ncbi:MAG: hypothetical protein IJT54_04455 [Candidatus Methanomethylophilaceae archaeon]|nr:hypothetical protein [Candidatus Methanomethylophilaceae archaeon]
MDADELFCPKCGGQTFNEVPGYYPGAWLSQDNESTAESEFCIQCDDCGRIWLVKSVYDELERMITSTNTTQYYLEPVEEDSSSFWNITEPHKSDPKAFWGEKPKDMKSNFWSANIKKRFHVRR